MHSDAEVGSWVQGVLEQNTSVFGLQALSLPLWTCFGAAMIVLKTISNNWLQVINLRQSHFPIIC